MGDFVENRKGSQAGPCGKRVFMVADLAKSGI